jgi:exopolysaccharide production protein ExoY
MGGALKRAGDLVIAAPVVILLAPAFLIITVLIFLTMGRPILYAHERVGFRGKTFKCYKFRTMVNNATEKLEAYLREFPAAREEWDRSQKLRFDRRVTPVGRLLRKSSLDEMPQLINVLRGDMSCVGPRPVTTSELQRYKSSARQYIKVRPGLTGLWQIRGRSNTSYEHRIALDRLYVTRWSSRLDIEILMKTFPAVYRFHESA